MLVNTQRISVSVFVGFDRSLVWGDLCALSSSSVPGGEAIDVRESEQVELLLSLSESLLPLSLFKYFV